MESTLMGEGQTTARSIADTPQVVYYVAASLDGFIATTDGSVEWLEPFEGSGEDYGYADFLAGVDGLLLGSRTYEQSLTFGQWPYAAKPAWIFSHRPIGAVQGVAVTDRTPAEVVAGAADRGLRRLWLVGGASLAASFRSAGLITEYVVSVMPVVLGGGIPLFAGPGPRERLRLLDTTRYGDGVVQLRYAVRGP